MTGESKASRNDSAPFGRQALPERVLVLDDDPAVGRTVCLILENNGLACRHVTRYIEFFDLLERWSPTHILLDLMMPNMDGVEVIGRLAEMDCRAHVILVSGVGSQVLEAARRAANANGIEVADVVSKPFTAATLKRALEKCTNQSAADDAHGAELTDSGSSRTLVSNADVDRGIREQQFTLAYQPIVRCTDGALARFEALARWRHPDHGFVSPDAFIGLAEESSRILTITRLVLEQGIEWLSLYPKPEIGLSLNLSPICLQDTDFTDHLIALCGHFGVEPEQLVLELTETAATQDKRAALSMLTRLRLRGIQLSIDDFGTGYSSMAQLAELPFSELKIDKSFTISAAHSDRSRSIIRSTVDLAHQLGLNVTAEGVEDGLALRYLREIGCDHAQGYFIARPMDGEAARAWEAEAARPSGSGSGFG